MSSSEERVNRANGNCSKCHLPVEDQWAGRVNGSAVFMENCRRCYPNSISVFYKPDETIDKTSSSEGVFGNTRRMRSGDIVETSLGCQRANDRVGSFKHDFNQCIVITTAMKNVSKIKGFQKTL